MDIDDFLLFSDSDGFSDYSVILRIVSIEWQQWIRDYAVTLMILDYSVAAMDFGQISDNLRIYIRVYEYQIELW